MDQEPDRFAPMVPSDKGIPSAVTLLQEIFPDRSELHLLSLLHYRWIFTTSTTKRCLQGGHALTSYLAYR